MLEILIQFLGWEDPLEKDRLPIQYSWASLVVQLVKNPPATWETWVGTIPWRREKLPTPVFWPGEFHGLYSPWGYKELDTTEQLSLHSQVALVVKNLPASVGDIRDVGLIPGSGRSPGKGHGNPFQYSCLENPMDRGATVHRVAQSQTQLK